jgi:protein TonB
LESRDYTGNARSSGGILHALGISIAGHLAIFSLVLFVAWAMPPGEVPVPLCTVSLLTLQDVGGGSGGSEYGSPGRGKDEREPAGGLELASVPKEVEVETVSELSPERPDVVHVPDGVEAPLPPPPVRKTIEKPKKKPKENLDPTPMTQRGGGLTAKEGSLQSSQSSAEEASGGGSARATKQHRKESTRGDTDDAENGGPGRNSGAGAGIENGSGVGIEKGSGSERGPLNASIGFGDGPRFLTKVRPKYPKLARELGKEGTVHLRLTIDELGRLRDVEVVKKAGSGLDEEAVRAVRSSTFSPAKRSGKPVTSSAHLSVRFVLGSAESD